MTYRCGVLWPGVEFSVPRIICDGCGVQRPITRGDRPPPAWFLANKAAPGWKLERSETETGITRRDLCPVCKDPKTLQKPGTNAGAAAS